MGLAVTVGLALATAAAGQQPDRARTEAMARRAAERLLALQHEADRLASEERTLLGELRKLEIERQLKAEVVRQLDAEGQKVQGELDGLRKRMDALRESDLRERPALKGRLVETYKLGQARYVRLLLSTPDLRRLGQASRTVAALARLDRERVAQHQKTLADLKTSSTALAERGKQLASVRSEAATAQAAAEQAARQRAELVRDIDRQRDLNAQLSGELHSAQLQMQEQLRGATSTETAALPIRPFKGELDWPVAGTVKRGFGRSALAMSNGIEIASIEGVSAMAVHDGTVAFAGPFGGFGKLVILDHGSQSYSLYGELLDIAVKKGDRLGRGQPVGTVGPTPSGAAGLYFELRVDGEPVDPLQWFKKR